MAGDSVDVRISADASGFRAGAKEASSQVDGLLAHLREFRTEEVQQGRMARFLAQGIGEIGIASQGAAAEIGKLGSAFAFGGGLGVGVELAKLAAHAIGEVVAEQEKARESIRQYGTDAAKGIAAVTEQIDHMILALRGASSAEILRHDIVLPLLKEEEGLKQKLIAATDKLGQARYAASFSTQSEKELEAAISKETAAVKDATAAYEAKRTERILAEKDIGRGTKAEIDLTREVEEAKQREEQATIESSMNLAAIAAAQDLHAIERTADFKKGMIQEIAEAQARADAASEASEINKLRIYTEQDRAQKAAALTEQALVEKTRELMKDARPFESAFQSAFKSIIDGSRTAGQALEDLGKGILMGIVDNLIKMATEAIVQMIAGMIIAKTAAVSTTQGYIAEAVAGAAASQAFIPFIGPGLAAGSAASMLALLEGMTGPLLSAAGGFDVPSGMNPIVQLHQREMVLPAPLADTVRARVSGDVHIHVHSLYADAGSLRHLPEDPGFRRGMREAIRNGQL